MERLTSARIWLWHNKAVTLTALRANRSPGKRVLTRGLRRLLDRLTTAAILADEIRQQGSLPPRLAAPRDRPDRE